MGLPSVCVVGAGAIGGVIGVSLAAAGHPTSVLARGATLAAVREHGWRLRRADRPEVSVRVQAEDEPARLGPADLLVIAVKGHALESLAPSLAPLVGPRTTVVAALNGIPWWFFTGIGGAAQGVTLPAVDRHGRIAAALPPHRTVGCVVHLAGDVPEPGVARLTGGRRLVVGDAMPTAALAGPVGSWLAAADFDVDVAVRVHNEVWFKLWGNLTMNPLSVLTGATTDRILGDDLVAGFVATAMGEAAAIGAAIGCPLRQDARDRMAVTRGLGPIRTSMLQDAQAGRSLELDPLVTAVQELGRHVGVATPAIDTLLGLTRLWGQVHGLYGGGSRAQETPDE